ncbi:unnamed protein product [Nezara viridula]|uniref:Uncharacterized protein n=1 Tax=Nezara viridula TaxID=85310 RepID=A0A9P0HB14_NEZVI|nr:unnamed protein product [Nezara viridula]
MDGTQSVSVAYFHCGASACFYTTSHFCAANIQLLTLNLLSYHLTIAVLVSPSSDAKERLRHDHVKNCFVLHQPIFVFQASYTERHLIAENLFSNLNRWIDSRIHTYGRPSISGDHLHQPLGQSILTYSRIDGNLSRVPAHYSTTPVQVLSKGLLLFPSHIGPTNHRAVGSRGPVQFGNAADLWSCFQIQASGN